MVHNQSLLPDDYLPLLDELNRIITASGTPLEGNLFYYHREPNLSRRTVYGFFYPKRRNFVAVCRAGTSMLEIGVNGGHSALLALACGVEYHGVDIGGHAYIRPVAEFLKSEFGERFHYYEGDSLKVLPALPARFPYLRFDVIHVDGHHGKHHVSQDFRNSLPMALKGAWMLLDDTDMPDIQGVYDEALREGVLVPEKPPGWEDFTGHNVARVAT